MSTGDVFSLADGRTWLSQRAWELDLIDGIENLLEKSEDDFMGQAQALAKRLGCRLSAAVKEVSRKRPDLFKRYLSQRKVVGNG